MDIPSITSSSDGSSSPVSQPECRSFASFFDTNSPHDYFSGDIQVLQSSSPTSNLGGKGKDRPQPLNRRETSESFFSDDVQNNQSLEDFESKNVNELQDSETLSVTENKSEAEEDSEETIFNRTSGGKVLLKKDSTASEFEPCMNEYKGGKVAVCVKLEERNEVNDFQPKENEESDENKTENGFFEEEEESVDDLHANKDESKLYNRFILSKRARLHKKPILRWLQSQDVDIDQYIDEVRCGGKLSNIKCTPKAQNSSHNAVTTSAVTQNSEQGSSSSTKFSVLPAFFSSAQEDESTSHKSKLATAASSSNLNMSVSVNSSNAIFVETTSIGTIHSSVQTGAGESSERISGTDLLSFQKDDTLAWCHQQIKLAEKLYPAKAKKARMKSKHDCLFYEAVLADSLPSNLHKHAETNEYSYLGVFKDPDRVEPPERLDELLHVLAAAAKVYIVEILTKAQTIEQAEFEKKKTVNTLVSEEDFRNCYEEKDIKRKKNNEEKSNNESNIKKENTTENTNENSCRIITTKHVYEAVRLMNSCII